jgi:cation diffusion facilitator CzcD-associated flavoprotein CzcO
VNYLENYAQELNLQPIFNTEVLSLKRTGDYWIAETNNGNYQSSFVIVATGMNHQPEIPVLKGMETFTGLVLHSSAYRNGEIFRGKNVLIVGFGNSGCEQAICLHEHGAYPSLSVRSAVNVLPRDIFGFPVLEIGKLTSVLPARIADKLNAPLIRLLVGNITKLGLRKSKYGPREQVEKMRRVPLLDIGTIRLIRKGHIKVFGDISTISGRTVYFENNRQQDFDAIILATGYRHNLQTFLPISIDRLDDLDKAFSKQTHFGQEGLYFCGFYVSPMGMLHEIGLEAVKIAKDILTKQRIVLPAP